MANRRRRAANNMGNISQRSGGRWQGRVSLEGGKRKYVYAATEPECVAKMQAVQADVRLGLPVRTDERLTVKEYLKSWLETKDIRPSTKKQYEVSIRLHIVPDLGKHRLKELTALHVRKWIAGKAAEGKVSPSTIRLAHATLKTALSQAVTDGLVVRNVAKLVRPLASRQYEARFLTVEQARKFLSTVQTHRLGALYALLLTVGLRKGEALGLSWDDVNLDDGKLSIRFTMQQVGQQLVRGEPKTKSSIRTIKLPPNTVTILREHKDRQGFERNRAGANWKGNPWNLVFTSEVGTPLEGTNINRQIAILLSDSGLGHLRVHDLRHTACALMLLKRIPVHVVSKILGHANPTVTLAIYAKVLPSQQDEAAAAMDALLYG